MVDETPVQTEIEDRIRAAFPDAEVLVRNDSAQHRGHSGDNGSGESHFSVTLYWSGFASKSRLARQRMVNKALGDLMAGRVHALAIHALVARNANES